MDTKFVDLYLEDNTFSLAYFRSHLGCIKSAQIARSTVRVNTMTSLMKDERGILFEYMQVVIAVGVVCFMFIILNELVFHISDIASNIVTTGEGATLIPFVVLCWRIIPFIIIGGLFAWSLWKAYHHEPHEQYMGQ